MKFKTVGPVVPFNAEAETQALVVAEAALNEFLDGRPNLFPPGNPSGFLATLLEAPAGAGKTFIVEDAVERFTARPERDLVVVTPTNAQAHELVARLARRLPSQTIAFLPAHGKNLPEQIPIRYPNVIEVDAHGAGDPGLRIVVATADKLGNAIGRNDLIRRFAGAIFDEAYQTSGRQLYLFGDLASRIFFVGDPGQLSPFSVYDQADRWRGQPCDPLQTAAGVLRRLHPGLSIYSLPITRRLPFSAIPVVQGFYPDRQIQSWTTADARQLRLVAGGTGSLDIALDLAARHGWAYLRMPEAAVYRDDPATAATIADTVARLLHGRSARVSSELTDYSPQPLAGAAVAVATAHRDQRAAVRAALDDRGLVDVVADTANRLQGLTFDVLFAWHPLAAQVDADGFHLDPGRLCVMLTRHRHACLVVGRSDDRRLLEGSPPLGDASMVDGPDSVLDGWFAHRHVLKHLAPFTVDVA